LGRWLGIRLRVGISRVVGAGDGQKGQGYDEQGESHRRSLAHSGENGKGGDKSGLIEMFFNPVRITPAIGNGMNRNGLAIHGVVNGPGKTLG